ncbi:MAG: phage portal protein [Acidobacteriota bacterium]
MTQRSALGHTGVLAAVQLLSSTIASVPLHLLARDADGGRERATSDPRYGMLRWEASPETTAFAFRQGQWMSILTSPGAAYAEIEYSRAGYPLRLWRIPPERVRPLRVWIEGGEVRTTRPEGDRSRGEIWYRVSQPTGGSDWLPPWRVLHQMWLSLDGVTPLSPIDIAAEALSTGVANLRYRSSIYENSAAPGAVYQRRENAPPMSREAEDKLLDRWEEMHRRPRQAGRLAIIQEGEYKPVGFSPEQAQLIEGAHFSVLDVCRIYQVPPHLLFHLEKATFSNIEHQNLQWLTLGLRARLVAEAQEYTRKILLPRERGELFLEHQLDELLRGDVATRWQAYRDGIEAGAMTPNQIAQRENLPPISPEQGGDTYRYNTSYGPATDLVRGRSEAA